MQKVEHSEMKNSALGKDWVGYTKIDISERTSVWGNLSFLWIAYFCWYRGGDPICISTIGQLIVEMTFVSFFMGKALLGLQLYF